MGAAQGRRLVYCDHPTQRTVWKLRGLKNKLEKLEKNYKKLKITQQLILSMNTNNDIEQEDIENEEPDETCIDCEGKPLASGDEVSVIKDLKVGGTKLTIKKGTVIKNIKLTGDIEEVECRYENMKGIILRTEFLRKRS